MATVEHNHCLHSRPPKRLECCGCGKVTADRRPPSAEAELADLHSRLRKWADTLTDSPQLRRILALLPPVEGSEPLTEEEK